MNADQPPGPLPQPRRTPRERGERRAAQGGTQSGPVRLPSLTGLRFAAAGGVVYTHASLLIHPGLASSFGPEVWVSMSSVSLFFILSGYVLTRSARATDTPCAFWRRRAAKILPNHVLTWCMAMAVLVYAGLASVTSGPEIVAALSNLFLVNTWVPVWRFVFAGNPVAWSLAAEMFFYLLFPALLPRVERLSRRGLLVGSAAAIGAVWMLPVVCRLVVDPTGALFPGYWFLYVLPVTRLPEFVLGMMAARFSATGGRLPRVGALSSGLSAVATIVTGGRYLPDTFMYAAATVLPLVLLVYATAELDLRGRPSLLRSPVAVFLGEISYATYLIHALVLTAAYKCLTDQGWSSVPAVLVALPFVPLASWLLYVGVERPCMRRFSAPRARTAPAS